MEFGAWLLSETFGNFEYRIPRDKKQQMADFYALSMLYNRSSFDLSRLKAIQKHGIDSYQFGKPFNVDNDFTHEDLVDYALNEAVQKLLPQLQKKLLKELLLAISSEVRHINDSMFDADISRLLKKSSANKNTIDKFQQFLSNFTSDYEGNHVLNGKIVRSNMSYAFLLDSGLDSDEFVKLCKFFFNNGEWGEDYGGRLWADICVAWSDLNKANSIPALFTQIDHVYDIQHNTGSVFNKLNTYENNGYKWIKEFLDKKATIRSPLELYVDLSPGIRKLILAASKLKFGSSLEQMNLPVVNLKKYKQQFSIASKYYKENLDLSRIISFIIPKNEFELLKNHYKNDVFYVLGDLFGKMPTKVIPFFDTTNMVTNAYENMDYIERKLSLRSRDRNTLNFIYSVLNSTFWNMFKNMNWSNYGLIQNAIKAAFPVLSLDDEMMSNLIKYIKYQLDNDVLTKAPLVLPKSNSYTSN